jgi:hypothetical protein
MTLTSNLAATPGRLFAAALACCGLAGPATAQPVKCHLSYGGAQRAFVVPPTQCAAATLTLVEGSSFAFKVLNLAGSDAAGVTIETQTRWDAQLQTTHKAQYQAWEANPTRPNTPYGFTGLQTVQGAGYTQPLQYWCERLLPSAQAPTTTACP